MANLLLGVERKRRLIENPRASAKHYFAGRRLKGAFQISATVGDRRATGVEREWKSLLLGAEGLEMLRDSEKAGKVDVG